MTVHFIGAGPGAADLVTVRGRDLLGRCPVCLYAGSMIPPELLNYCAAGARLVDTAPMTLDEIEAECVTAHAAGQDVARLHSGDLSVFSAVAEQIRRLKRRGIPYTLTPGVPAFAAAAALLGRELTVPELSQSVVLTRVPGRASQMPGAERLQNFLEEVSLDTDREEEEKDRGDAVILITMHSCKGLEFPHVYVVGIEDNLLPHSRSKVEGTLDEERRLFYVAMTRAMQTLTLSYCLGRKKYGQLLPCHPSPFLKELPPELVEMADEKAKQPVAPNSGKDYFAAMRQSLG